MVNKTYFGRMRGGGSTAQLQSLSALSGILLAAIFGGIVAWFGYQEHFTAALLVFAAAFVFPLGSVFWLLLVDRDTMTQAPKNPEDTVEFNWYEKATHQALHDLLLIIGVGAAALSIASATGLMELNLPLHLVLAGLVVVIFIDVAVRYLILKKMHS